ncbi:hypothetical protein [Halarcobacter bivalviorum]|uniref:Membrane protein n=1 Tax=Halarcobacter bivalviorum TaxID=663364 RepID=A0AAX2A9F8_9BACT|nr:hypothetical protein [Halarcobacter bivalviorum]AXH13118.1 putative membrane protein [Halarcobacter bivalviorum]RXK10267.1 hypothetical protein CRV05_07780 [Halarcobacter bivalviorum]
MNSNCKTIYKNLSTPENSGKKIGLFRTLCSIFGGLLVSYLFMTLLTFLIPAPLGESLVIPIYLYTLLWAVLSFWIALSYTKLIALKRVFIPSLICAIGILLFILGS